MEYKGMVLGLIFVCTLLKLFSIRGLEGNIAGRYWTVFLMKCPLLVVFSEIQVSMIYVCLLLLSGPDAFCVNLISMFHGCAVVWLL